jgi:hypothetical protein
VPDLPSPVREAGRADQTRGPPPAHQDGAQARGQIRRRCDPDEQDLAWGVMEHDRPEGLRQDTYRAADFAHRTLFLGSETALSHILEPSPMDI